MKEAAKFETESAAGANTKAGESGAPTVAVVSLLTCVYGDRREAIAGVAGSAPALRAALQELGAAASGGRSQNDVVAAELLWCPGEPDEVLEEREMLLDWPELIRV